MISEANTLRVRSIGIDTYRENIIFMHADCPICKSEGFTALTRVIVKFNKTEIIATLNVVTSNLIGHDEAALSTEAMMRLGIKDGNMISIEHLRPIESLSKVRSKMYGAELTENDFNEIIGDVVLGRYSNVELSAFITACAGNNLTVSEITSLTKAMINTSDKINWDDKMILDKHSVGGIPGNRTTPIVVSIVAAAGLIIPKTSSRAITSPAGTADTLETMMNVNLSIEEIKTVVKKEGGCMAWGGAVKLSPADDILISVERSLDIDSEGQMIASVLSKKAAAGATHVVIDVPVGPTAKIRSMEEGLKLQYHFKAVAEAIGLQVEVVLTNGEQPVGFGIGPVLESMDVLSVLRNEADAPQALRNRAITLAGTLLELSGKFLKGAGVDIATNILQSEEALKKFMAICEAQGGFKEPVLAKYKYEVRSENSGTAKLIDNRKLARIAKLAGAPRSQGAGIRFSCPLGTRLNAGDLLFTVYAESEGELTYVKDYIKTLSNLIILE